MRGILSTRFPEIVKNPNKYVEKIKAYLEVKTKVPHTVAFRVFKDCLMVSWRSRPYDNLEDKIFSTPKHFNLDQMSLTLGLPMLAGGTHESAPDQLADFLRRNYMHRMSHRVGGPLAYIHLDEDNNLWGQNDVWGLQALYYRIDAEILSTDPSILALLFTSTPDEFHFSTYLRFGIDFSGRTGWEQIRMLRQGEAYKNGATFPWFDSRTFRDVNDREHRGHPNTDLKCSRKLERFFIQAMDNLIRTPSVDTPKHGISLSGGMDSSIVFKYLVPSLSKIKDKRASIDVDLQGYYLELGENYVNEKGERVNYVDDLIEGSGIKLNKFEHEPLSVEKIVDVTNSVIDLGGTEPLMNITEKMVNDGIRTIWTGDGSDEIFGGYRRSEAYDSMGSDLSVETPYYTAIKMSGISNYYEVDFMSPFLDICLMAFVMRSPWQLRQGHKFLLRHLANGLPESIRNRQKTPMVTKENRGMDEREKVHLRKERIEIFKDLKID